MSAKSEIQLARPSGMDLLAELSRKVNDPQAAIEIAKQIVELETRWEGLRQSRDRFDWEKLEREAKVAFADAFKRFKDEAPKILKTKHVSFPSKDAAKPATSYWHVELDKACELLIPALLKVGITHRWKSTDLPAGVTRVTCFLRHSLGYEEEGASLAGPADQSGGKNPIQGVGSSTSYLERYTFLATCGIVAAGKDDDGDGGTGTGLAEQHVNKGPCDCIRCVHLSLIGGAAEKEECVSEYRTAFIAAEKINDWVSIEKFKEMKNARLKELDTK